MSLSSEYYSVIRIQNISNLTSSNHFQIRRISRARAKKRHVIRRARRRRRHRRERGAARVRWVVTIVTRCVNSVSIQRTCVVFCSFFSFVQFCVESRKKGERERERGRKKERGSRQETPQDKSAFFLLHRVRRSPSGWRTTITRTAPVTATYPRSSWSLRWVCHARSRIAMRARQTDQNGTLKLLKGRERKTEKKGGGCPMRTMGVEQPTGFRLLLQGNRRLIFGSSLLSRWNAATVKLTVRR